MVVLIDQARSIFLDISIGTIYNEAVLGSQYLKLEIEYDDILREVIYLEFVDKSRRNVINADDRLESQTQRDGLELQLQSPQHVRFAISPRKTY